MRKTLWCTLACSKSLPRKSTFTLLSKPYWRVEISDLNFLQFFRGENLAGKDIGQVAKTLEKNIDNNEDQNDEDDFDIDDAPIFTPELARLKAKE